MKTEMSNCIKEKLRMFAKKAKQHEASAYKDVRLTDSISVDISEERGLGL